MRSTVCRESPIEMAAIMAVSACLAGRLRRRAATSNSKSRQAMPTEHAMDAIICQIRFLDAKALMLDMIKSVFDKW